MAITKTKLKPLMPVEVVKNEAVSRYANKIAVGEKALMAGKIDGRAYVVKPGLQSVYELCLKNAELRTLRGKEARELLATAPKAADTLITAAPGCVSSTGSDPEIMVVDEDGAILPAWLFLPGKDAKVRGVKSSAFWDGAQAEINFEAASCHCWVVDRIRDGLRTVYSEARKKFPKARLTPAPVVDLPQEAAITATKEQLALGCMPSLNVYGPKNHLEDIDPTALPFRFAGFHIHLGSKFTRVVEVVRTIDAVVGVCSVLLLRGLEDERRRRYYGLAGEYRTPPHGIEYRTISSAALCHPVVTHLHLDLARAAARLGEAGAGSLWKASDDELQECINTLNVDMALAIVERNMECLMALMRHCRYDQRPYKHGYEDRFSYCHNGPTVLENAIMLIRDGASAHLDCTNMEKSWHLPGGWVDHSDGDNCQMSRFHHPSNS